MNILNIIGLLLDIFGATLIFLNSPEVRSQVYIYSKSELKEIEVRDRKTRNRARAGFALLAIGFLFQLVGNFATV